MDTTTWYDVRSEFRRRGPGRFASDVVRRFREADGTSHARALAYQVALVSISGFIGLVGLASVLGVRMVRDVVVELARRVSPGPASRLLEEAARQGSSSGSTAMLVGLGAALVAGTFAMAQVERSANRLFGSSEDRPSAERYGIALVLAITAGLLIGLGLLVMGAGRSVSSSAVWTVVRWPLGIAISGGGLYLLFRAAPRIRPASTTPTAVGAGVAIVLWTVFTLLLGLYFSISSSSTQTYGPLLAVIALLLWSVLTSLAVHLGLAVTAELSGATRSDRVIRMPEGVSFSAADR